ncbi:MAG: hypothetical protein OXM56_11640 [Gammaproteobacteria bacterium]|nr:hypothetical protein [Gammaproteobacteria bacterium]
MTLEFWAIIAVGVALATLTLNGHRRLHARLDRLEDRLGGETKEVGDRLGRVEVGASDVRERVAYVEGLLEGLRDALRDVLVGKGLPEPPRPRRVGG